MKIDEAMHASRTLNLLEKKQEADAVGKTPTIYTCIRSKITRKWEFLVFSSTKYAV